jgi:hypothetical protein
MDPGIGQASAGARSLHPAEPLAHAAPGRSARAPRATAILHQPNFAVLLLAAWLIIAIELLVQYWTQTGVTLNDTDDAMRLVQLRAWLAGQGWFDLHEPRVQPPTGYDPHWSRLIDAGLAGVYLPLRLVFDAPLAERLMRAMWPMLWLVPTIAGSAATAWRLAGREAALIVLMFAVLALPAFQQFAPGRIDHHNVQIAIAVLAVAATAWSDRARWCAGAAGALTGVGLAIGLEGVPFLVLCGAFFALRYILDRAAGKLLRAYGFAAAASTVLAFVVNVSPSQWSQSACDTLAINSAAAVAVATLGLALVTLCRDHRMLARAVLVAMATLEAAAVFALTEPFCLLGPYAMMDPAVKPLWLAHVSEMQPLLSVFRENPLSGLAVSLFPAAGAIAMLALAASRDMRSDFGFWIAGAALLLALAVTVAAVKGYSYAMWLAMAPVAAMALRLSALLRLRSLVPRFIVGLLFAPAVLTAGAISVAEAAGWNRTDRPERPERQACFRSGSYGALAQLPTGLVVADIDYGPFILALTPHAVLAAPYHRLSPGVTQAHRVFASPPNQARRLLRRVHANYVVLCGSRPPADLPEAERSASLWSRLHAGEIPNWLVAEPSAPDSPLRIYRVRP